MDPDFGQAANHNAAHATQNLYPLIRNPSCQPCYTNPILLILISRMGPSKELDPTRNQGPIFFWDLLGEYGVFMG